MPWNFLSLFLVLKKLILFIYLFVFGCAGSLLLHRLFSSFSKWGCSLTVELCGDFCSEVWAVGVQASLAAARGLPSCNARALEHRLNSWDGGTPLQVGSSWTRDGTLCFLHCQVDSLPPYSREVRKEPPREPCLETSDYLLFFFGV